MIIHVVHIYREIKHARVTVAREGVGNMMRASLMQKCTVSAAYYVLTLV